MNASNEREYIIALLYLRESERADGAALVPAVKHLLDHLEVMDVALAVVREDATAEELELAEAEAEAHPATSSRDELAAALSAPGVLSLGASVRGRDRSTVDLKLGVGLGSPRGTNLMQDTPRELNAILAVGADGWGLDFACDVLAGWVRSCVEQVDVLHGGIALISSYVEASIEASLVGRDTNAEVEARWLYDSRRRRHLWSHARRLYWITVLGPDLATRSGGASAAMAAGADHVEEIAGSLVVRATPHIREASDRAKTASLRRWLWPHSIQNPADADFESAKVVLATAGRLVIESPTLGRRVLVASIPELKRGDELRVAFPGVGDTLVMQLSDALGRPRTLVFGPDNRLVDDHITRLSPPKRRP